MALVVGVALAATGCSGGNDAAPSPVPATTLGATTEVPNAQSAAPDGTAATADSANTPTTSGSGGDTEPVAFPADAELADRSALIAGIGSANDERVWVDDQNRLHAAGHSIEIELDDTERTFRKEFADLLVAEVGGAPLIVLRHPTAGVEDPPNRHQLFRVDADGIELVYSVVVNQHTVLEVEATSVGYDTVDEAKCWREGADTAAVLRVELDLAPNGPWSEASREPTGERVDCIAVTAG